MTQMSDCMSMVANVEEVACETCGEKDLIIDDGFYYCSICGTRSENLSQRVAQDEYEDGPQRARLHLKLLTDAISAKQRKKNKAEIVTPDWTTWEGYNVILKELVNILLRLGAPEELKDRVFALWVRYLQVIQAAFVSTEQEEGPAFAHRTHQRDLHVIHSIPMESKRRKAKERRDNETNETNDETNLAKKRRWNKEKRKAMEQLYMKSDSMLQGSTSEEEEGENELDNSKRIKLTERAQQMNASSEGIPNTSMKLADIERVTMKRIISVLHLALLMLKSKIMGCDILRWQREGHLPMQGFKLLPESLAIKQADSFIFSVVDVSVESTYAQTYFLMKLLDINHLPKQDIRKQIERFVIDLQLPGSMVGFTYNLMRKSSPHLLSSCSIDNHDIPVYEGFVLGYILTALKLLFGLDGTTEKRLSEAANRLNQKINVDYLLEASFMDCVDNTATSNEPLMFVWDKWVNYTNYKYVLLEREYFPRRVKTNFVPLGNKEQFWQHKTDCEEVFSAINAGGATDLKVRPMVDVEGCVVRLLSSDDTSSYKSYKYSWYPTRRFVRDYINRKESGKRRFHPACESEVIEENHCTTSLDFVLNPEELSDKHPGLIKIIPKSAKQKFPHVNKICIYQPWKTFWTLPVNNLSGIKYHELESCIPNVYMWLLNLFSDLIEMSPMNFYRDILTKVERSCLNIEQLPSAKKSNRKKKLRNHELRISRKGPPPQRLKRGKNWETVLYESALKLVDEIIPD